MEVEGEPTPTPVPTAPLPLTPTPTPTDRDAAYTEYVTSRLAWLRRVAYLLCRDWHRADDLVQTTVTKLYATWQRAEKMGQLDGYTRKILVNTFLAEQRSPWWKRVAAHDEAAGAVQASRQSQQSDSAATGSDLESVLDLRAALATLPPRQRATLVLRYYDQLSVIETAQALGCSTGNVKSQTSRALATLRRTLGAPEVAEGTHSASNASHARTDLRGSGSADPLIEHVRLEGAKP